MPKWALPKKPDALKPMAQRELAAAKKKPKIKPGDLEPLVPDPHPEKFAGKGVKKKPAARKAAPKPKAPAPKAAPKGAAKAAPKGAAKGAAKAKAKAGAERGTDYGRSKKEWKQGFMREYPNASAWEFEEAWKASPECQFALSEMSEQELKRRRFSHLVIHA